MSQTCIKQEIKKKLKIWDSSNQGLSLFVQDTTTQWL